MSYEEKMQEIEYYILEHYGIYGVGMFNIMCGIAMGTTAFAVIYIIVPTISAVVILCVCSVVSRNKSAATNLGRSNLFILHTHRIARNRAWTRLKLK